MVRTREKSSLVGLGTYQIWPLPRKMEWDAAPESLLKIISCNCKKGCKNACGCRKEDVPFLPNDETNDQKGGSFTSQELRDIYDLARNISHSKGHITKSEEGDPEYRRSYIRKVIRETKFETLKVWFTKHANASGEYSVSDLQELEYLVHQVGSMDFFLPCSDYFAATLVQSTKEK
ncbi:hypothetical protein AVEN_111100-1 [Araneus ventricosus]|uniref:Uncharacterized protein n=1 Tax=Araneus ventricosus TaxID=182803 RepID=A0A4Y2DQ49_ARAVE|nr:hypothetical protein AVEN_111100-1 [Araneus ventricosus]